MRLRLAALLALPLLAAACGRSAHDVLSQTAGNLGKVRSGDVSVLMIVEPHGRDSKSFGFRLQGPFSLGPPTVARIKYTQIANGSEGVATLVLKPDEAYAETDKGRRAISPSQAEQLRSAARQLGGGKGKDVAVDWITDAKKIDCGPSTVPVECVGGKLDPVATVNGLATLSNELSGGTATTIGKAEAAQLRQATRSTKFTLISGKKDHLLRLLTMQVDLAFDVPADLRAALGNLVGAKITFELAIAKPNEPVSVD